MAATTLYEVLGIPGQVPGGDRGRTERTAKPETIDNDRAVIDLYASLGDAVPGGRSEVGRTEITRERPETVDRDRAVETLNSTLTGPTTDLYYALSQQARCVAGDVGETAITAATETIDWDQPPELPAFR